VATTEIPSKPVLIQNVRATRETDKGLLCFWGDDGVPHWIARRYIAAASEVRQAGDTGKLIVDRWFANTAKLVAHA
jgi:hypothetical protein